MKGGLCIYFCFFELVVCRLARLEHIHSLYTEVVVVYVSCTTYHTPSVALQCDSRWEVWGMRLAVSRPQSPKSRACNVSPAQQHG